MGNMEKALLYYATTLDAQRKPVKAPGDEGIYITVTDENVYEALSSMADILYDAQMFVDAIQLYREALGLKPSNPQLWYQLGTSFLATNNYDEATFAFNRSLAYAKDEGIHEYTYMYTYKLEQLESSSFLYFVIHTYITYIHTYVHTCIHSN